VVLEFGLPSLLSFVVAVAGVVGTTWLGVSSEGKMPAGKAMAMQAALFLIGMFLISGGLFLLTALGLS
jgi:hypothetical protein